MNLNNSKRLLSCMGFLLSLSLAIAPVAAQAQAIRLISVQPHAIQPHNTQVKQIRGQVPGRRRGGARRGDCPAAPIAVTALVPVTEVSTSTLPETYVGGSTIAERPTFWFYVPYSLTTELTAEFILQDDRGEEVYHLYSANFPTSEKTPGIISVSLPSTTSPLIIGKMYQWYFKLSCKVEAFTYVQGGIERITLSPDLASRLANASPQDQANLYLENDIWYDAVTVLGQSRRARPTDAAIESAWINLLRSVKLEDIPTN
jgi:Domain of Unknown Function (DUF928)